MCNSNELKMNENKQNQKVTVIDMNRDSDAAHASKS